MPRKKNDPDRVVDDDDFLRDAPRPSPHDLPKDVGIVSEPIHKKIEPETEPHTRVDGLTTKYLGNGKLPIWMKDSVRIKSRKEVDEDAKSSSIE